jgi:hypothetical protein
VKVAYAHTEFGKFLYSVSNPHWLLVVTRTRR